MLNSSTFLGFNYLEICRSTFLLETPCRLSIRDVNVRFKEHMMAKEPGTSLRETILKSDLPSVIESVGEISIDSILDKGLLKDVPILRTLHALGKAVGNIKDYLFAKKMMKFLQCISTISTKQRKKLISKLENDENFGIYAGEIIIELLSRVDGYKKPVLVANALKLYARGDISSTELQRINNAIDRFMLCDLNELRSFCAVNAKSRATDENPITANLINSGLAYVGSGWGGGGVHPTETAKLFIRVVDEKI